MGHIGDLQHPDVQKTIDGALKKIVDSGRTAGTLMNQENAERYTELGVRCAFTTVGAWIAKGAKEFADTVNKVAK